jgi:hypothetical protein
MAYGKGPIKTGKMGKGGKELPPIEKRSKQIKKLKASVLSPVKARTIDPSKKTKPVQPKRPGGR